MSHSDWTDFSGEPSFNLVVTDTQEIACRSFIFNKIGTQTFVLHFEDLKFSFPKSMVGKGVGCIIHEGVRIDYEVFSDQTVLKSDNRDKLISFVIEALDEYCE